MTLLKEDITLNLRYPGQYYDSESNLHYNYFRYYDPELGRYITPDPIGLEGGVNRYLYVGGNPVGFVDPSGLASPTTIVGVFFIAAEIYLYWDSINDAYDYVKTSIFNLEKSENIPLINPVKDIEAYSKASIKYNEIMLDQLSNSTNFGKESTKDILTKGWNIGDKTETTTSCIYEISK